jgi:dinuclear metal center YbgI/SA1388 family protein
MIINNIIEHLERLAPTSLQEDYDNAGLICGNKNWLCTGVIITLDATEAIVDEAIAAGCNCIVAHHPILFAAIKKLNGNNYVEQTIIKAIKNNIAIYAIHTNLDNVLYGVNGNIAALLQLQHLQVLLPKANCIKKLVCYCPIAHVHKVEQALFTAGAGNIGNYSNCNFKVQGQGTFTANEFAKPFIGEKNKPHVETEIKIEIVFNSWQQQSIVKALIAAHPYQEVAYQVFNIDNVQQNIGSGVVGTLATPITEPQFLQLLKQKFNTQCIKHTAFLNKPISKVAICGGAGSFLIKYARQAKADIFITSDVKYHEFFDAENDLLLADIGHFESEQYTTNLIFDILKEKFPTFAVLKTKLNTNPVHYYI